MRLCSLYSVSPNEILGYAETTERVPACQWTTQDRLGDLPDGLYIIAYYDTKSKFTVENGSVFLNTRTAYLRVGRWYSAVNSQPIDLYKNTIVSAVPFLDAPEGYTYSLGGDASGG